MRNWYWLLLLLSIPCYAQDFDSQPQTQISRIAGEVTWQEVQSATNAVEQAAANAVKISFPAGNRVSYNGSGVYLGDQYIATCYHVPRGTQGRGTAVFRDGWTTGVTVNGTDSQWDQAILTMDTEHPSLPGVDIAEANPQPGQRIYSAGFGQGFRLFGGAVTSFAGNGSGTTDWFNHQGAAVSGDSGGPMFTESGKLVGCLWGTGQGQTIGTSTGRFRVFVKPLFPVLARWRANRIANQIAGVCPPGGSCYPPPQAQPPQGYPGSRPTTPGTPGNVTPVEPPAYQPLPPSGAAPKCEECEPGPQGEPGPAGPQGPPGEDGRDGIDASVTPEQLGAIAAAITAQLKNDPELRGPQGPAGPQGPPGDAGQGVTQDQIDQITAVVLARVQFPDRRVVLVDGVTGKVIDDETYRYNEPIVLDLKSVINAARVR